MSGFYEWSTIGKAKQPYHVDTSDYRPLFAAPEPALRAHQCKRKLLLMRRVAGISWGAFRMSVIFSPSLESS